MNSRYNLYEIMYSIKCNKVSENENKGHILYGDKFYNI